MKKNYLIVILAVLFASNGLFSQQLSPEELLRGRWLSQEEYNNRGNLNILEPSDAPEGPIQAIGEFESMQGVLIAYPFGIPMNLIVEMSEIARVTTIVSSQSQANTVTSTYESAGVNMENVDFLIEPHDTYWTRDYGPWFIREEDQISIVNFTYNRPRPDDDIMPVNVANMLGIPYYNMPVVHTGGNYMCDGFGIAAQTELVYEENSISNDQVDQYMEDYLGITDNFVIPDPLGDYIKHIDCWGKFLDTDKVLVAEVPESDPRYDDYEAAADYFATRNCAYGYPFEVVRVYAPGDYPYTPYTNSLILNNKVFLPITGSQWDEEAIATYEEAMPGYEIVPIMAGNDDWLNTDALHCRTHEIADIGMLKITHIPAYHGEVEYQMSYEIDAKIHPYSGADLYPDSLLVYYKINDGEYESMVMADMGDEIYMAEIAANPGDEVAYYIHAADESGRSENAPYIGGYDPFTFTISSNDPSYLKITPDSLYYFEDNHVYVKNIGTDNILIDTIHGGAYYNETYVFGDFDPIIEEYPYSLAPNDSIDITIDFYIGSREIWWDQLQVVTADSTYICMIGNDITETQEINHKNSIKLLPNPMISNGIISVILEESAPVQIEIYQLNGQLIKTLENSRLSAGTHEFMWDGKTNAGDNMDAGVYLVKFQIGDETQIQKWIKM